LKDSIRNARGTVNGVDMVVSCMDFAFIGGSLGSVMGEKIRRAVDYCIKTTSLYDYLSVWWC
jgi:acetyl-CoA carboxylase carboxyl transferase subunit beta